MVVYDKIHFRVSEETMMDENELYRQATIEMNQETAETVEPKKETSNRAT